MLRYAEGGAAADGSELRGVERVRKQRRERRARRLAKRVAIVGGTLAVVVGTYAAGFSHYRDHLLPNTTIAGLDVSGMDEDAVREALSSLRDTYAIDVTGDELDFDVAGSAIDYDFDVDEAVRLAFGGQDVSSWPRALFESTDRMPEVTFSEDKLQGLVEDAVEEFNRGAKAPVAATPVLNNKDDHFNVRSERPGTQVEADAVVRKVTDAAAEVVPQVTLDEGDLIPPAYVADSPEMAEALERANAVFGRTIDLVRDGQTLATVEPATFKAWLKVHDDLTIGLDEEQASTWLDETCWHELDYATDEVIYTVDAAATAHALSEALRTADATSAEVTYVLTPCYVDRDHQITRAAWDSELGRYLDVDKSHQVATLFDDTGRIIYETIVTTGNEASKDGTPTGTFAIYEKVRDTVLIGLDQDEDGEPDYEHHVNYWMPFVGNIGLHDADWRTTYGGTEYLERGSGGCVNLPMEAAGVLFNVTHVDEVVCVHD